MADLVSIGDTVTLISSNQRMTVNARFGNFEDGRVEFECVWFVGTDLKRGRFDQRALKKIVESVRVDSSGVIHVTVPGSRRT